MTKSNQSLYAEEKDCCGCGACAYVCPKAAIRLEIGSFGAYYPSIDLNKCIGCNVCIKTCSFQKEDGKNAIVKAWAVANKNEEQIMRSSSGGVFSAIASYCLDHGYVVCGAVMDMSDDGNHIRHRMITGKDELPLLQGSKYGQSRVFDLYETCEKLLKAGKKILFSGTPCQVNAFRHLFSDHASQILTLDLICHGVPGNQVFDDYIRFIESRDKCKVTALTFRDKEYGWGCTGTYSMIKAEMNGNERNGKAECKAFSSNLSSYYAYFLSGETYRDSCYECPFATSKRVGDLTIGDYWGIEKYNPELLMENGGPFLSRRGISCVLANTEKGLELIEKVSPFCEFAEVDKENVIKGNTQLNHPVSLSEKRFRLLAAYQKSGYAGIEKEFRWDLRKKEWKKRISRLVPSRIKNRIRGLTKRNNG